MNCRLCYSSGPNVTAGSVPQRDTGSRALSEPYLTQPASQPSPLCDIRSYRYARRSSTAVSASSYPGLAMTAAAEPSATAASITTLLIDLDDCLYDVDVRS